MGKTTLNGNVNVRPSIRTDPPLYRIETLWCEYCDREIDYSEPSCQVNTMSGERDIHGPYHYPNCATKVRDALNGN